MVLECRNVYIYIYILFRQQFVLRKDWWTREAPSETRYSQKLLSVPYVQLQGSQRRLYLGNDSYLGNHAISFMPASWIWRLD